MKGKKNWKYSALLSAVLLLGLMTLTTACDSDAPATTGGEAAEEVDDFDLQGDAAAGQALYTQHCAACHGADGDGDGPGGRALNPPPTDFTAEALPAGRAYTAVRDGGMAVGKAATMPGFERSMSDEEIHHVVAYILSLGR